MTPSLFVAATTAHTVAVVNGDPAPSNLGWFVFDTAMLLAFPAGMLAAWLLDRLALRRARRLYGEKKK